MKRYDLEERLINYSVNIIKLSRSIQKNFEGIYLSQQIIRSGTSSALNYGEAQGAESMRDFIHKMRICLKELRETHISLQIMLRIDCCYEKSSLKDMIRENNELISIFVRSIETASKK